MVAIVDGRPGHEKQTFGIIEALGKRKTVTSTVIDVSKRSIFAQWLSYAELFLKLPLTTITIPAEADLVIGAGTRTHTSIINVKERLNVPGITCMTPGRHLRRYFDLCFVPEHDGNPQRSNYFFTYGAPNANVNKGKHLHNEGLILIGGVDDKSHVWDSKQIVEQIIEVVSREYGVHWTISSSPRTPASTVELLEKELQTHKNGRFFDFKDTEKGWVEEQYQKCKTVWVTTDSISMVYEALSSGCTVNVFTMPWKRATGKFKRNEDLLIKKGFVTPYSDWKSGTASHPQLSQFNEAQRCADHIVQTCLQKN